MEKQSLVNIGSDNGNNSDSLKVLADNFKAMIENRSDEAAQAVDFELRRRPGLIGLLFPGKILKENEEFAIQNMKDVYQSRQEMFKAYVNIQMEILRNEGQMIIKSKLQKYEGELSQQAMQIRTDLTEFSQNKIAEMMNTFDRSRASFLERIDRQYKDAEKYKDNGFLYENLKKNLDKEIQMFFSTIEELLDGFKEALHNKLNQN